jgi:molybdopterin-containing oxidoreductase family iron-sulfur binding subunit
LGLLHELTVVKGIGPLAQIMTLGQILAPFTLEQVAKTSGVEKSELSALATDLAANAGKSAVLAGGSASAGELGDALEVAVNLINYSLGNLGKTFDLNGPQAQGDDLASVEKALKDVASGRYSVVLVFGVNPVYDLPMLNPREALSKAQLLVSLNDRIDETTQRFDWIAPASHPFESWSDTDFGGGLYSIQQPVIQPLYRTHSLLDALIAWGGQVKSSPGLADAIEKAKVDPTIIPNSEKPIPGLDYHYVRRVWRSRFFLTPENPLPKDLDFEHFWEEALRQGYFQSPTFNAPTELSLNEGAVQSLNGLKATVSTALELTTFPHHAMADGRSANNGWLYEYPDPITRITWGDWVSLAPRRFDEMGLRIGDLLDIRVNGKTLTLPAYRHPGMHNDQIGIPLGFGRSAAGKVGNGIGQHSLAAMTLDNGRLIRAGVTVEIAKNGGFSEIAIPQGGDIIDRKRRPLVPVATLSELKENNKSGTEQVPGGESMWSGHSYEGVRWGMTIDLSKCNGCGKCTIACMAENNIPVVGKKGITKGREMNWIRIDRYFDAPEKDGGWNDKVWDGPLEVVEEPRTLFEPMLCQHCENAPCETVCPFAATLHSEDGLNQQIYNRCVGTRYCANNCPFKVRRFNWFEYSYERTSWLFNMLVPEMKTHALLNVRGRMQMKNNPEVTVRSRGVMEKCSFCIQRIRAAYTAATVDGRPKQIKDGEVIPACMEACPTGAISFGNVNDPTAAVTGNSKSPRAMKLLELTGVKPAISYLTKVRNDNSEG